jgi:hypothetical protein
MDKTIQMVSGKFFTKNYIVSSQRITILVRTNYFFNKKRKIIIDIMKEKAMILEKNIKLIDYLLYYY